MQKLYQTEPLFFKLASITLFSKIGDRLFYTALLSSATLLTTHRGLAVIIISLSETLPLLLGFILGSLADQCLNKLKALSQTSLLRCFFYLVISLLAGYSTTFTFILMIAWLNFCSDLLGNYASALTTPFTKILVSAEQMQQAQSFLSMGTQLFNVLATFLGSFLLIFISQSHLALINALIFFIVALAFRKLSPSLVQAQSTLLVPAKISLSQALKQNFGALYHHHTLFIILLQLTLLNGFFGGLTPIFALFIKEDPQLLWIPLPLKLALLSGLITSGMILGNFSCQKLFPKATLTSLTLLADLLALVTGIAFNTQNIYLILCSSGIAAFLLGIIAPRFSTQIINTFPVTQLGGIVTIVNSFLVIMPPLTSLLFPVLFSFDLAYLCLIIYGIFLVLLSLLEKIRLFS